MRGDGCIKCAGIYTPTTEEWIKNVKAKHGNDKFDYSKVVYINAYTEVIIGCNICGKDFKQTPTSHMYSEIGCDWCRKKYVYTTEEYIEEAKKIHGDRFDYSKVEYKSALDNCWMGTFDTIYGYYYIISIIENFSHSFRTN